MHRYIPSFTYSEQGCADLNAYLSIFSKPDKSAEIDSIKGWEKRVISMGFVFVSYYCETPPDNSVNLTSYRRSSCTFMTERSVGLEL